MPLPKVEVAKVLTMQCVVAALDAYGIPEFTFCIVKCRPEQYKDSDHYEAAGIWAARNDYKPRLVYDDIDMGGSLSWLQERFVWASASVIDITELEECPDQYNVPPETKA